MLDGHRLGDKDARADQKILPDDRRCGDFLRLAKRTLVSFGNHTCNFAIMFWCICYINDFSCDYKSSVFVLWVEKAGYTALSKRQESGCKGLVCASDCSRCAVEPLRVEPPVADFKPVRVMDGYCLQQEAGGAFVFSSYKRHDSHAAGGDSQASQLMQPVDFLRLKRMEA